MAIPSAADIMRISPAKSAFEDNTGSGGDIARTIGAGITRTVASGFALYVPGGLTIAATGNLVIEADAVVELG